MIYLALGIIIVAFGAAIIVSFVFSRLRCRKKITATIDKVLVKSIKLRGSSIKRYTPIFRYTVGEREYTQKLYTSAGNEKKYVVGDKVELYIDESNPTVFRFGNDLPIMLLGIALLIIGAILIICFFL